MVDIWRYCKTAIVGKDHGGERTHLMPALGMEGCIRGFVAWCTSRRCVCDAPRYIAAKKKSLSVPFSHVQVLRPCHVASCP